MTRIYIVRHAEAEGNLYRRAHGWYNSLITQRGYRQIAALAHRFEQVHIDAAYSSDLFRTMTTARGRPTRPMAWSCTPFRPCWEIILGDWEDMPWGEILRRDGVRMKQFSTASPDFQAPGGESFAQAGGRVYGAVMDIARAHPGQTVGGVLPRYGDPPAPGHHPGHGPPGRSAPWATRTTPPSPAWRWRTGRRGWCFENDNSHLPEEISTLAHQSWWRHRGRQRRRPQPVVRASGIWSTTASSTTRPARRRGSISTAL